MSLESVKAFYESLRTDEVLRAQIQGVQSKEECSQIVKNAGYDFTPEEFEEYTTNLLESALADSELTDLDEKELASIVGGASSFYGRYDKHDRHHRPKYPWELVIQPMYGVISWSPISPIDKPIAQPMYGIVVADDI